MRSIGQIVKAALRGAGIHAYSWKNLPWGISMERDLQRIHAKLAKPLLIDVGANVGQTALRFQRALPQAEIWCFEPIPSVYKELCCNTRHLQSVACERKAVGASNGLAWMMVGANSEESRIVDETVVQAKDRVQVPLITIDSFLAEKGIEHVHLLKTDCEGFDLDALRGATASLSAGVITSVLCEVTLNEKSFHSSFWQLDEFLRAKGFYFFAFYDYNGWGRFHSEGQFHNALWLRRE